jgi:hypothetical protein
MQNLPAWIPIPRSWFNALGLILLMAGIQWATSYLWVIIRPIIGLPRIGLLVYFLLFIAGPIVLIAFIHHWLHRILDEFFPDSRIPDTEALQGTFPTLLSWWQGLYGWVVNYLSVIVWTLLLVIVFPIPFGFSSVSSMLLLAAPVNPINPWYIAEFVVKVIAAAFFYQFEYSVQRHILAAASRS